MLFDYFVFRISCNERLQTEVRRTGVGLQLGLTVAGPWAGMESQTVSECGTPEQCPDVRAAARQRRSHEPAARTVNVAQGGATGRQGMDATHWPDQVSSRD